MNLRRLGSSRDEAEQKLTTIKRALEEVRRETEGASCLECFRKSNLRRTSIAFLPLCMFSAAGASFAASYSTYYAQTVGYSTEMSFKIQIIQQVLSLIGNVISWWLISRVGRRQVTFWSSFILMVFLFIIGALATEGSSKALTGANVFLLLWCFVFNIGLASPPRSHSTSTGKNSLDRFGSSKCVLRYVGFCPPLSFNPDKLNLGGKISFIYAGLTVLCLVYLYFFLPETGGRTYEELVELFMKKVPAREFKDYKTDAKERRMQAKAVTDGAEKETTQ